MSTRGHAAAVDGFWHEYVDRLSPQHPHRRVVPEAFAFAGGGPLADELALLVLAGRKRATTSLAIEFTADHEPLPTTGSLAVILRADGSPAAIIERTDVRTVPFDDVDADYAAIEGEGDGSLAGWREDHRRYFSAVARGEFDDRTPVICQRFRVVWPPSAVGD